MKNYKAFSDKMKQYKANLHSHSTVSDGLLDRSEMIALYKNNGYKVLSFTEHELYTNTLEYDSDEFIVLPGIERSVSNMPNKEEFHINGIGDPSSNKLLEDKTFIPAVKFESLTDIQKIIDDLKESDNFVTINHPYWSTNLVENILPLKNYDAIEIYNHNCEVGNGTGNSEVYYDYIMWNKAKKYAIAADDNHSSNRYESGVNNADCCGGWINILSENFSRQDIFNSLKSGLFYSSEGPIINNYGIRNEKIFVDCENCSKVVFITYPRRGYAFKEKEINSFEYTLRGKEKYARIVCADQNGKRAWTNYFEI